MKEPVNQHKMMAMGDGVMPDQNFGVGPFNNGGGRQDEPDLGKKKHMGDRSRGAPKVNGYHPQPDHGPTD